MAVVMTPSLDQRLKTRMIKVPTRGIFSNCDPSLSLNPRHVGLARVTHIYRSCASIVPFDLTPKLL